MRINRQNLKISGLITGIIIIYFSLFLQIANNQKIALGVKAAGIEIGGEKETAQEKLQTKWQEFAGRPIELKYQDKAWQITLNDLGFELNNQKTIGLACQLDKKNNFFSNLITQYQAILGQIQIKISYNLNLDKFQETTGQIFKEAEKPAQNAGLEFDSEKNKFRLAPASKGVIIDRQKLLLQLDSNIQTFARQPIKLSLILDSPTVENHEVETAQNQAQHIISHQPYSLSFENWTYQITAEKLISWFKFLPIDDPDNPDNQILGLEIDKDKVKDYLSQIAKNIDRPYTNAQLEIQDNRAVKFTPPADGFEVKQDQTYQRLIENLNSEKPAKNIAIIADTAKPKINLPMTNKLGINQLISQGTSNYAGSSNNRIHNIKTGANQISGYILPPEEELSFNQIIPETSAETGYLPEYVIKKNKTALEYGGGLCQVSTTLFRAAVNAGLNITERHPHAFPVGYYNPQGFDATVYSPWTDLRFINNTPNHILIDSYTSGYNLYFNLYGTDDGRQVKVKGPWILEKNEDGSMKAILKLEVYQDQELVHQQEFYSAYKSPDLYPIEQEDSGQTTE